MTYPNVYGKLRTRAELREEYDTLARLHTQACLAYRDSANPHVQSTRRLLVAAGVKLAAAR